jgi:hypothetical protein
MTESVPYEEPHLERLRRLIEEAYSGHPTACGHSFGEILCYEVHSAGLTFVRLAQKWGVSLSTLGELIWDHCKRLEEDPVVRHDFRPD